MLASQWLGHSRNLARVVLAHGFTQNARCWGEFGERCSESFDTIAIDAPGHGWSGFDESNLDQAGQMLVDTGGLAHYVGYSMGGRMLLHAALNNSQDIRSLILIGATAGIVDEQERTERRQRDAALAQHIRSVGTRVFIDEWLKQPMFEMLTDAQSGRPFRYENAAEGMAASLENCGAGSQRPLWDQLAQIQMPVLVIAGSNDAKYTAIGQQMVEAIGDNARFVNIDGGHAVHLENPYVTAAVIASWGEQLTAR